MVVFSAEYFVDGYLSAGDLVIATVGEDDISGEVLWIDDEGDMISLIVFASDAQKLASGSSISIRPAP